MVKIHHSLGKAPLSHTLLIIVLALFLPVISALSLTNLTIPANADRSKCTAVSLLELRVGTVQNCAAAILTLPTLSSRPLTFHGPSSGPPSDAGRLPILTRVRDCTLAVDMPDGQTETSSWAAVALAANLLVAACADVVLNSAYSGGYTHVGDEREGIVVALFKTGTVGVGGVGG